MQYKKVCQWDIDFGQLSEMEYLLEPVSRSTLVGTKWTSSTDGGMSHNNILPWMQIRLLCAFLLANYRQRKHGIHCRNPPITILWQWPNAKGYCMFVFLTALLWFRRGEGWFSPWSPPSSYGLEVAVCFPGTNPWAYVLPGNCWPSWETSDCTCSNPVGSISSPCCPTRTSWPFPRGYIR